MSAISYAKALPLGGVKPIRAFTSGIYDTTRQKLTSLSDRNFDRTPAPANLNLGDYLSPIRDFTARAGGNDPSLAQRSNDLFDRMMSTGAFTGFEVSHGGYPEFVPLVGDKGRELGLLLMVNGRERLGPVLGLNDQIPAGLYCFDGEQLVVDTENLAVVNGPTTRVDVKRKARELISPTTSQRVNLDGPGYYTDIGSSVEWTGWDLLPRIGEKRPSFLLHPFYEIRFKLKIADRERKRRTGVAQQVVDGLSDTVFGKEALDLIENIVSKERA